MKRFRIAYPSNIPLLKKVKRKRAQQPSNDESNIETTCVGPVHCTDLDNSGNSQVDYSDQNTPIQLSYDPECLHEICEPIDQRSSQIPMDANNDDLQNLNEPLHNLTSLSKHDIMYMVLCFFIRHNITIEAVTDLLKMLNVIIGTECLPETYYGFSNAFRFSDYVKHFCCSSCEYYFSDPEEICICPCCGDDQRVYFVTLPLKNQLITLVRKHRDGINATKTKHNTSEVLSDIHAGRVLKDDDEHMLSISFSSDGVSTANSNVKKSMWPIVSVINDLPMEKRFARRNMILSGIWLSQGSPPMTVFLKAFTQELEHLYSDGLEIDGTIYKFRVAAVIADVPGKSKIINMTQFNGRFGCNYCYHPGTKISNNQIRYSHKNSRMFKDRTHSEQISAMVEAHTTGIQVKGIKGLSPLVPLKQFDIVKQIPIDYMHNCLLGVTKTLLTLWTDSKNHRKSWYLGSIRRKAVLKARYDQICGFNEVSRAPRNVFDVTKLKANEIQDWLLYYSIVYLGGVLPEKYLTHFKLFRASVSKLLSKNITMFDLIIIKQDLVKFVVTFEKLYGVKSMTFNVHLILHLTDQIENFGPLWTVSMFCYEDFYGYLKGLIKGPNGPIIQIVRKYSLMKSCHFTFDTNLSNKATNYYSTIFKTCSVQRKKKETVSIQFSDTTDEYFQLTYHYHSGVKYKTKSKNTKKNDDSLIWYSINDEEQFACIVNILFNDVNNNYIFELELMASIQIDFNMYYLEETNKKMLLEITEDLQITKCIRLLHKELYCSKFINPLYKD